MCCYKHLLQSNCVLHRCIQCMYGKIIHGGLSPWAKQQYNYQLQNAHRTLLNAVFLLPIPPHTHTHMLHIPRTQPLFITLSQVWSGCQDEVVLLSVLSNLLNSMSPFTTVCMGVCVCVCVYAHACACVFACVHCLWFACESLCVGVHCMCANASMCACVHVLPLSLECLRCCGGGWVPASATVGEGPYR